VRLGDVHRLSEVTSVEKEERSDRSGAGGGNRSAVTVRSEPEAFRIQYVRVELVALGVLVLSPGAGLLSALSQLGLRELFGTLPEDDDEMFHGWARFLGGRRSRSVLGVKTGCAQGQRGHGEEGGKGVHALTLAAGQRGEL